MKCMVNIQKYFYVYNFKNEGLDYVEMLWTYMKCCSIPSLPGARGEACRGGDNFNHAI